MLGQWICQPALPPLQNHTLKSQVASQSDSDDTTTTTTSSTWKSISQSYPKVLSYLRSHVRQLNFRNKILEAELIELQLNQIEEVNTFNGAMDTFPDNIARLTVAHTCQALINTQTLKTILEPNTAYTDGTLQSLTSLIINEKALAKRDMELLKSKEMGNCIAALPMKSYHNWIKINKNKEHFTNLLDQSKKQPPVTLDGIKLSDFEVSLSKTEQSKLTAKDGPATWVWGRTCSLPASS